MIRVDGRARFLDCPPPDDDAMKEYVDAIMNAQGEEKDRRHTLEHKGAVDVAYSHARRWPASARTSSTAARSTRSSCGGS